MFSRFRSMVKRWKRLALLTGIALSAGIAYFYYVPADTMVLREDGWHPRVLTIEPGTSVTFVNATRNAFWPASDPHPQHTAYEGFDAGTPVAAGGRWSFTFDQEGKWGLHDHLRSFYTGFIAVGTDAVTYDCTEHLAGANVEKKRVCWEQTLDEELLLHGAQAAFRLFAQFYASDPDFTVVGCHLIAHHLGDTAYGEYVREGKNLKVFAFPPETVFCGYGYYHGILEHLIRDHPDLTEADTFCKKLSAEHEADIPRIRLNCYHAIGHGFVPEPTDIEQWGNTQALTAPAVEACSNLREEDIRIECLQGAFNVIGDWMWQEQFGLNFPKKDALSLCAGFEDRRVAKACYYELAMRLAPLVQDDLQQLYQHFVASIPDDDIAGMVINSAAAAVVGAHIEEENFLPYLKECRGLPARVQVDCLKGISGAFVAHGEPEKEYVKAVAFCSSATLTVSEKDICYANIVRTFKGAYTPGKVGAICEQIEQPYRHYCVYE